MEQILLVLGNPSPIAGFAPVAANDKPVAGSNADVDPTALTFVVTGPTDQGIPPGKYRVKVTHKSAEGPGGQKSYLPDALGSDASPMVIEIQDVAKPLTVDVGSTPKVSQ